MQGHLDAHELLLSLDDELPPRQLARVAHHISACTMCRDRADHLRSTLQDVEALYRAEHEAPSSSLDFRRVRLEGVLREAAAQRPSLVGSLVAPRLGDSLFPGAGVAAVIVAVCTVAVIAMRTPGDASIVAGTLPESSLTPGAVSHLTAAELCNGVRPSRLVTEDMRELVLRAYRMETAPADSYELDALITPELGGSTDRANLWPQLYHSPVWNARVKDELEGLLPEMVCSHRITLGQAQHEIATDWIAAYKRHFKTDSPLRAHRDPAGEDEEELVIVRSESTRVQIAKILLVNR